jgi:hypothetical protein
MNDKNGGLELWSDGGLEERRPPARRCVRRGRLFGVHALACGKLRDMLKHGHPTNARLHLRLGQIAPQPNTPPLQRSIPSAVPLGIKRSLSGQGSQALVKPCKIGATISPPMHYSFLPKFESSQVVPLFGTSQGTTDWEKRQGLAHSTMLSPLQCPLVGAGCACPRGLGLRQSSAALLRLLSANVAENVPLVSAFFRLFRLFPHKKIKFFRIVRTP